VRIGARVVAVSRILSGTWGCDVGFGTGTGRHLSHRQRGQTCTAAARWTLIDSVSGAAPAFEPSARARAGMHMSATPSTPAPDQSMLIPAVLQHGCSRSFSRGSAGAAVFPQPDVDLGAAGDFRRAIDCGEIGWLACHYACEHTAAKGDWLLSRVPLSPIGPVINTVEHHRRQQSTARHLPPHLLPLQGRRRSPRPRAARFNPIRGPAMIPSTAVSKPVRAIGGFFALSLDTLISIPGSTPTPTSPPTPSPQHGNHR
jgi:hypothetical protein